MGSLPDIHCLVVHLNLRPGFPSTASSSVSTWVRSLTSQSFSPHSENGDSMPTWVLLSATNFLLNGLYTVGATELETVWNERRLDPSAPLPPPSAPG